MKRWFCLSVLVFSFVALSAQGNYTIQGSIKGDNGEAIEYATIILLGTDSTQVAGAVCDNKGLFSIKANRGEYQLAVQYLGYQNHKQSIVLTKNVTLEPITLTVSTVSMEEIIVKNRFITREADRFVVNVAGSPQAIGKDALEMLKNAPGVWVDQDNIMINGNRGCRVMIDDRLLNMSGDELNQYLRNINAEDIQKVEVIPVAGADYDADSQSGIIKITLKRQRNNGIEGDVATKYKATKETNGIMPSFNINYRQNKLSLYAGLNLYIDEEYARFEEQVIYHTSGRKINSNNTLRNNSKYYNAKLGAIYDIDSKQSVGMEVSSNNYSANAKSLGTSAMKSGDNSSQTENQSKYLIDDNSKRFNATLNYILKLDTLGSTFKIITDFNLRKSDEANDYINRASTGSVVTDSVYRSSVVSDYNIFSITANFDKHLNKVVKLRTGGKFSYNRMENNSLYEGLQGESWIKDNIYSSENNYSERIAALYGTADAKFSKVSLSVGLRGEYTNAVPDSNKDVDMSVAKQNYFSLFPNINLSVPLNSKQSNSLILSYSRKISRPGFWALNPSRTQLSEYSYVSGNPWLRPTFKNNFSVSGVIAYKYNLSIGADMIVDGITQILSADAEDPSILVYRSENVPQECNYFISANIPIDITKWWTLNANLLGLRQSISHNNTTRNGNSFFSNASTAFTLPKDFFIDVAFSYRTSVMSGNLNIEPVYNIDVSVKKRLFKGRLTAAVNVDNILPGTSDLNIFADEPQYYKTTFAQHTWNMQTLTLSVKYNFKSGITFKSKSIEKGNNDEASRMGN